jgi:topoisomerase IV subunit A
VIARIDKGLKPHKKKFYREITTEDIVKLTEIRIKRISRYDSFKADEMLKDLEKELKETKHNLAHLTDYAIAYFQKLMEKYGKGRERRTEIKSFQSVSATEVIANNQKLMINVTDGFVGYSLKRDDKNRFVADCSELDNVIVIRKDGKALVSKVQEKAFMGKDILYVGIWKKADDRMTYNVVYSDGKSGRTFAKRFNLPGVTRDKEYDLGQGTPNSKIHYVTGNPNGEAETIQVTLSPASTARKKVFEFDFADLEVKGRSSRGNIITQYPVRKVEKSKDGMSTLSKIDLWYDDASGRLNKEGRGKKLGKFDGDDQIIAFMRNGSYRITNYDLANRYDPEKTMRVEKFNSKKTISAVYVDGESKQYMVKRFVIETSTVDKEFGFISEGIGSRLVVISTAESPEIEMEIQKAKDKPRKMEKKNLDDLVEVKGWKAMGNRLSEYKVFKVSLLEDEEESGLEEGDEDNELMDGAEAQKKKMRGHQILLPLTTKAKPGSSPSPKNQKARKGSASASSKKPSPASKSKPSSKTSSAGKSKAAPKKSAPKKAAPKKSAPKKTVTKKVVKAAKKKKK